VEVLNTEKFGFAGPADHTAEEYAKTSTYYIMDLTKNMAETVAEYMLTVAEVAAQQMVQRRRRPRLRV
jgi:hypothetical protein